MLYHAHHYAKDAKTVVGHLSRYLEHPTNVHWKAAVRVLRYLKSTRYVGVHYCAVRRGLQLETYSDSDWASAKDDRKSVRRARSRQR